MVRPAPFERARLEQVRLDPAFGADGDGWLERRSRHARDGSPDPDRQVTLMASRAAALFAGSDDPAAWTWFGDQLYVDIDLSVANLPPGSRLGIGTAVLEIAAAPHTGCPKFAERFGRDASRLLTTERGKALRLRGANARVVTAGEVATGDAVVKRHR